MQKNRNLKEAMPLIKIYQDTRIIHAECIEKNPKFVVTVTV